MKTVSAKDAFKFNDSKYQESLTVKVHSQLVFWIGNLYFILIYQHCHLHNTGKQSMLKNQHFTPQTK